MNLFRVYIFLVLAAQCASLQAYVGPGMSGGVIAVVFGILGAIILALFGVLYYPIKRAFKGRRTKAKELSDKDNSGLEEKDETDNEGTEP